MRIRPEQPADVAEIAGVVERAFLGHPFSDQTEHFIVRALRDSGALTLSLVAESEGAIVGHLAFSPVHVADGTPDWYGLGPLAVEPELQGRGIGSQLVREGLPALQALGAAGCVLVGEASYYERFGFRAAEGLTYPGLPPEHFLALSFGAPLPRGEVAYHEAFAAES